MSKLCNDVTCSSSPSASSKLPSEKCCSSDSLMFPPACKIDCLASKTTRLSLIYECLGRDTTSILGLIKAVCFEHLYMSFYEFIYGNQNRNTFNMQYKRFCNLSSALNLGPFPSACWTICWFWNLTFSYRQTLCASSWSACFSPNLFPGFWKHSHEEFCQIKLMIWKKIIVKLGFLKHQFTIIFCLHHW